jgi:hypothetical protein
VHWQLRFESTRTPQSVARTLLGYRSIVAAATKLNLGIKSRVTACFYLIGWTNFNQTRASSPILAAPGSEQMTCLHNVCIWRGPHQKQSGGRLFDDVRMMIASVCRASLQAPGTVPPPGPYSANKAALAHSNLQRANDLHPRGEAHSTE